MDEHRTASPEHWRNGGVGVEAQAARKRDWRGQLVGSHTPLFNFETLTYLVDNNTEDPQVLLNQFWENNSTSPVCFQLLCLLGVNPTGLKNRQDMQDFLDVAKTAWDEEHGSSAAREARNQKYEAECLLHESESLEPVPKKVIALSIAGGGSSSIDGTLILRFVSNRVFGNEQIAKRVHWIAGSAAGSITAINLIKTNATATPSDSLNLLKSIYKSRDFRTKNSARLEQILQQKFLQQTMASNSVPRVCLTSIKVTPGPTLPFIHRNYQHGPEGKSKMLLRSAAMAACADPRRFKPFYDEQSRLFISNGPTYTPIGVLNKEIREHSPNVELFAILSIETEKRRNERASMKAKMRWYGLALTAIRDFMDIHLPYHPKTNGELIDSVLNVNQSELESALTLRLNSGTHRRFLRLNPPRRSVLPSQPKEIKNLCEYKQVIRMWDALRYLIQPDTLAIIDAYQRAYQGSPELRALL